MTLQRSTENNLVIGLGPTGLAAAIEAARNDRFKRNVIAITDRPAYTRETIFRLDETVCHYIESLLEEKFQESLHSKIMSNIEVSADNIPYRTMQIRTLENLLYDKLCEYKNVEIIQIPTHSGPQNITIDKHKRVLHLKLEEVVRTIPFKHLFAADGGHHRTLSNIQNSGIEYDNTQLPVSHPWQARVSFLLPENTSTEDYQNFLKQGPDNKPSLNELRKMGWDHFSEPEARMFVLDNHFYIGAECPADLYGKENSSVDSWIRQVLRFYLPQKTIDHLIQLEAGTFKISLDEATHTLLPLPSPTTAFNDQEVLHQATSYFFSLGDALRKPHYHTGSGAVIGLLEAQALGQYLSSEQQVIDLKRYHAEVASIRTTNRLRVDNFLSKRAIREEKAAKEQPLSQRNLTKLVANSLSSVLRRESNKQKRPSTPQPMEERGSLDIRKPFSI